MGFSSRAAISLSTSDLNLALCCSYRQRGHDDPGELIPVRRHDQLKVTADGVKLLRRDAFITEIVLTTPNLGVFI
jgi:hypothetical protein